MAAIIQPQPWRRQPPFPAKADRNRFPHLVSFWPLNDTSSVVKDIAGFNSAASATVVQGTNGRFGKTLFYSGNEHVRINSATGIATGNSPITISIWGNVSQVISSPRQLIVVNNSSGGGSTAAMQVLCKADNTIAFFKESGQQLVASGFSPTIGRWFHVAASWDGTTNRIYINGTEFANSTTAHSVGALDHIYIGDYQAGGNESWRGHLALPAIFDLALTPSDIYTLYNEPWVLCAPLPRRIFAGPTSSGVTTYTATATLDAAIQEAKTATATLDAAIQVANTKTATLDGVIATRNTATVTLDAAIQQAVTATVTLDAAIQATITASSTLDAVIQNAGVNTYTATATIDAAIREAKSLTATLDAAIQIANTKTVTLDGVIVSVNTKTATLDATIQAAATLYALLDAYIFDADAPVVETDTRQTPAGKSKQTRNSRRRYIMPDDTIIMATPDEAEQLVKLFVKPKAPKKAQAKRVVKELRKVDLVEFEPQSSDTVVTERIVVKPRQAVWETKTDVYEKAMKLLVDREMKRRRHEEELILLSA